MDKKTDLDGDFQAVQKRWVTLLVGNESTDFSDPAIRASVERQTHQATVLWQSMQPNPTTDLWFGTSTATSSKDLTTTARQLLALAIVCELRGSSLYHDPKLIADLRRGLDWLLQTRYNDQVSTQYDNWWDWQIGVPLQLNSILALLFDELSPKEIEDATNAVTHFTNTISATGANGIWRADILLKTGILTRNPEPVLVAQKWMNNAMLTYANGPGNPNQYGFTEGFYTDGSFFAHGRNPYNGGYGLSAFLFASQMVSVVAGSPWDVADEKREILLHWYRDSFRPLIFNGVLFDNVRGREISRTTPENASTPDELALPGTQVYRALLNLVTWLPQEQAAELKGDLRREVAPEFFPQFDIHQIGVLRAIQADPTISGAPRISAFKHFSMMARTSVLRPAFGASVAMTSDAVYDFEYLNLENPKGWHCGDGWLQILNSDIGQFSDGYWPTVDWHRLPGTTVVRNSVKPPASLNGSNWAGGTSLDDRIGSTGLELRPGLTEDINQKTKAVETKPDGQTLTARKSWFFFNDEIVCLGSGITASDDQPVETIIENRRISDLVHTLTIDGKIRTPQIGKEETISASSLHLAGNVPGSDLSFIFPQPVLLHTLREARTGSWKEINTLSGSDRKLTRNYQTIWIDQGIRPSAASYVYAILPGKTAEEGAQRAAHPDFEVLDDSPEVHAVRQSSTGIVGANFWQDAPTSVAIAGKPWLTCDRKAGVMMHTGNHRATIALSDPTRANRQAITVTLAEQATKVLEKSPAIRVVTLEPELVITLDLSEIPPDSAGQTYRIVLEN